MSCITKCTTNFAAQAREKVALWQLANSDDVYGGRTSTFSLQGEYFAIVEPSSGRESNINENLRAIVSHKITLRYLAAYAVLPTAAKWKFIIDSIDYPIEHIVNLHQDMKRKGTAYTIFYCSQNALEVS